jgi:methyl-accepting chemotaxis protein
MQRISGLLVVGMTAVALAAGCGGDDDSGSSATTDWANGVCEAISTWGDSVESTGESLRSGATNADDLREAVDEFEQATRTFVDDLRKLGKPDTEAGDKAQEEIEQLADDVDENVSKMKDAAEEASGASGILEAATTISGTLSTMGQQLSSTFAELEQLDAEGELDQAFRDADACDELSNEDS